MIWLFKVFMLNEAIYHRQEHIIKAVTVIITIFPLHLLLSFLSVCEPLLGEIFFEGEDLKHSTCKDNDRFNHCDENNLIVDFNVRLSKFIFNFAVHLLIFDELFSSSFNNINFLLQFSDVTLFGCVFLDFLFLISND